MMLKMLDHLCTIWINGDIIELEDPPCDHGDVHSINMLVLMFECPDSLIHFLRHTCIFHQ